MDFADAFDRRILPTVDHLRASGSTPTWFGLGFIQLKLDDRHRMHFWHQELSADVPEEELHDHRYGFLSRILVGEATTEQWEFDEGLHGSHEMTHVSCEPDVRFPPSGDAVRGEPRRVGRYALREGSTYELPHAAFHRVRADKAVTFLRRDGRVKPFARVIRPVGGAHVCPFSRFIEPDRLWEYVADLLAQEARPGYHLSRIERGHVGEPGKIREECEEFMDAVAQGVSVMALVELSDLQGAVEAYLKRHHPSISMADLASMSRVTRRAFENGRR